ncbi:MAG: PAS domain S-box protein [Victivallales bacterium]|nr:PAS domain S-box protein [Victivallales bacterium]
MKPNTALAFLLAGVALVLLSPGARSPGRARLGQLLGWLVVLIGGLTLCEFAFGWDLRIDELLFKDDPSAVATSSPGRMAPSSAVGFVLFGLALVGIEWEPRRGFRPAELLALVVAVVSLSSLIEYAIGQPILYGFSQYTRMALHTAAAFFVLSAGVLLAQPAQGMVGLLRAGRISVFEKAAYGVTGLMLLVVLACGGWFYHDQEQRAREDVGARLESIAQLKANQIVRWRSERLADAAVLMDSRFLAEGVAHWLADPQVGEGEKVLARLLTTQESYHYHNVVLVDRRGRGLLSTSDLPTAVDERDVQALDTAFRTRQPVMTDLRGPLGEAMPHLAVIAPLFDGNGNANEPLGAAILEIETQRFLYPLIQSWPTPSTSAETILVRRDGDAVLFLNELRHRSGAAHKLRVPLTRQDVPPVLAVQGKEGVFVGTDCCGVKVLAVLKTLPDTPWFMVAKMDAEEAFGPWRKQAVFILALMALLAAVVLTAGGIIWQMSTRAHLRAQAAEALHSLHARLTNTVDAASLGTWEWNVQTGDAVLNERWAAIIGLSLQEISPTSIETWARYCHPDDLKVINELLEMHFRGETDFYEFEGRMKHKDGSWIWVLDRGKVISWTEEGKPLVMFGTHMDITARKQAEEDLRSSEERFESAFEQAPIGMALVAPDGHWLQVNQALCAMLGYSGTELLARTFQDLTHPDDLAEDLSLVRQLLAGETQSYQMEKRYFHQSGAIVWAVLNVSLVRTAQGQPLHFISQIQDITLRKQAESELRRSEERYRVLFKSSRDAIMTLAPPAWTFTSCNPAAVAMFGARDEAEFVSLGPWQVSPELQPDGRSSAEKAREVIETAMQEGSHFLEWTHTQLSGEEFPATVLLTRATLGEQTFLQATVRDISAQKRTEKELREYQDHLEQLVEERTVALQIKNSVFDASIAGNSIADMNGTITQANPAFLRLWGASGLDDVVGEPMGDFLQNKDEAAMIIAALDATGEWEGDYTARRKDGSTFAAHAVATTISDPQGRTCGYQSSVIDLTERKRAEAELGRAKDAAEAASRSKSAFVANMSHEIRTPLNAIIGLTHLALKTELSPRQRDYLGKVRGSSHGLLAVVNDVLDFSKIEAGELQLETIEFELASVTRRLFDVFGLQAEQKGLQLFFKVDADVPAMLVGDATRLHQVLTNLLGNALKFTESGQVTLAVRRADGAEAAGSATHITPCVTLEFLVTDTGVGIPSDQLSKLFQAFSQADSSTTRKFGGTGLGLSISKRLVGMMGGDIRARSQPAQGSTFAFTAAFGKPEHKRGMKFLGIGSELQGLRALVVDDDEAVRGTLASRLEALGLLPTAASSGKEAVVMLHGAPSEAPIELLLVDWDMPGENGLELCDRIRKDASLRPTPRTILVSGYWNRELAACVDEGRADAFLLKPLTPSTLHETVLRVFADRLVAGPPLLAGAATESTVPDLRGMRVLLTEDNELNQEVALGMLAETGCVVNVARNGTEAVEAFEQTAFELVLMDIQMPQMDGYEATRRIRNAAAGSGIRPPIIAMTAGAMKEDRDKALAAGMDDHIAKPVDPDELYRVLDRWLGPGAGHSREPDTSGQTATRDETWEDRLRGLDVIDVDAALVPFRGDAARLRAFLRKFGENQANVAEEIRAALGAGDREGAQRLAHTLKGLAGTIGEERLQGAARAVEAALRAGGDDDNTRPLVLALDQRLQGTLDSLAPLIMEPAPVPTTAGADQAVAIGDIVPALSRLAALLQGHDPAALECVQDLATKPIPQALSTALHQVDKLVGRYAFKEALARLNDLAGSLGLDLAEENPDDN